MPKPKTMKELQKRIVELGEERDGLQDKLKKAERDLAFAHIALSTSGECLVELATAEDPTELQRAKNRLPQGVLDLITLRRDGYVVIDRMGTLKQIEPPVDDT